MGDLRKLQTEKRNVLFGPTMRQFLGHDSFVGLALPCHRNYEPCVLGGLESSASARCKFKGFHGHVVIDCDDGIGVVPVPFRSRPFLNFVLTHLISMKQISEAERRMLLETENEKIKQLKEHMTPWETKLTKASASELEKAFNFCFAGLC